MPDQAGHRQTGEGVRDLAGRVCPVFGAAPWSSATLAWASRKLSRQAMYMPDDCSPRNRPGAGAPGSAVGGEGALHRGIIGSAVVMAMPEHQQPGKLTVRAGRPCIVPVEHGRLARGLDQHVAGVQSRWQVNSRSPAMGVTRSARSRSKPACPAIASPLAGSVPARRAGDQGSTPGPETRAVFRMALPYVTCLGPGNRC